MNHLTKISLLFALLVFFGFHGLKGLAESGLLSEQKLPAGEEGDLPDTGDFPGRWQIPPPLPEYPVAREEAGPPAPAPSAPADPSLEPGKREEYSAFLTDLDNFSRIYRANLRAATLGEIAEGQGESTWVKHLGRRMKLDFSYANRRLMGLMEPVKTPDADSRDAIGLPVPGAREKGDSAKRLRSLQGREFEREFLRLAGEADQEALQALSTVLRLQPRSSDLFGYASVMEPVLEQVEKVTVNLTEEHFPSSTNL